MKAKYAVEAEAHSGWRWSRRCRRATRPCAPLWAAPPAILQAPARRWAAAPAPAAPPEWRSAPPPAKHCQQCLILAWANGVFISRLGLQCSRADLQIQGSGRGKFTALTATAAEICMIRAIQHGAVRCSAPRRRRWPPAWPSRAAGAAQPHGTHSPSRAAGAVAAPLWL